MSPSRDAASDRPAEWSAGLCAALVARLPARARHEVWVTGSVGRGEAVPGSDLETLAVAEGPPVTTSDAVALPGPPWFAAASPADAADARVAMPAEAWRGTALRSAAEPAAARGLVVLGLLADARPLVTPVVTGPSADLLPRFAVDAVRAHPGVLVHVLTDALSRPVHVPSRLTSRVRTDVEVDVKDGVLTPLVAIARWAALRAGITARGTAGRLEAAADPDVLPVAHWESLARTARELGELRWDVRLRGDPHGPGSDTVPLSALTGRERTTLRAAARDVAGTRRVLRHLLEAGQLGRAR